MKKFFTIPGYGNSSNDHWQSYFESQLDNCIRINQNSWTQPILEDWIHKIDDAIPKKDLSYAILITHSLGGIALIHWAKKFKRKIKGALIVDPPDLEIPYEDLKLESFTPIPLDKLLFPSTLVCSSNDNWTSIDRSFEFAKSWGSKIIALENAGHINQDSGHKKWDDGLEILKELTKKTYKNA